MPPKQPTSKPKSQSTATSSQPSPASATKNSYLLLYNAVSAALWGSVLYKVVNTVVEHGVGDVKSGWGNVKVYDEAEEWTRLVQTGAVLEVAHSLLGIVRAPLLTTLMQVSSRLLLTWGIAHQFPETTRGNPAFASMLVAWSVTEVIRYGYFAFSLSGIGVPGVLTWLRYNTFLILYPLGVSSELYLIYSTLSTYPASSKIKLLLPFDLSTPPVAAKLHPYYPHFLVGIILTYVPGFYTLFTHMLAQRRRILRAR